MGTQLKVPNFKKRNNINSEQVLFIYSSEDDLMTEASFQFIDSATLLGRGGGGGE